MNDFWTTVLDFAQTTTTRVGKRLMEDYGQVQAVQKADGSLVTQADQWADQEIRDAIASTFSGYGILSEEGERVFPGTEWCWVIDPLDGTTNFTRGIPIWSISLALLYRGVPIFGYVYVPPLNQAFHGFWAGNSGLTTPSGAFLNHHPIHTSIDAPSSNHFFNLCSRSLAVVEQGFPCKIRMLGVASYNFLTVAAGATLGGVEATPKVWDIAGVWVIVQAAGGSWISLDSQPFPLVSAEDYSDRSFPTLVVSRSELVPFFTPFTQKIKI
ncbi:inositol monophosphatase family protein [Nostoc sp. UHCC 0870]|jgi:myo-inositol-1(or 4)-monophosphatase|uniref:inositol monophosphatase family protein n=1 Tax=Nostoc sp. UHCC 0870 TaxID=2914041 RepID=UPI001EDF11C0|nr:inositol monophosphatase family protein [Nostoc sp. UHCC 0870]UKO98404.1 inositol monophosphatase family protein [Nostoc sp. UHCC 0870]